MNTTAPTVQEVLDLIEQLPSEDQNLVTEIVQKRLAAQHRAILLAEVREARAAYRVGDVSRGTLDDLLSELEE